MPSTLGKAQRYEGACEMMTGGHWFSVRLCTDPRCNAEDFHVAHDGFDSAEALSVVERTINLAADIQRFAKAHSDCSCAFCRLDPLVAGL